MTAEHHVVDDIPAYALGSLEEDEARRVSEHLRVCGACRNELASFEAVAGQLALAAPTVSPPAELKDRLMKRVQPAAPTHLAKPSGWQSLLQRLRRGFEMPAWQPAAVLLVAALIISNVILWQRLNQMGALPSNQHETVVLTGTEAAPEARGVIVISSDGLHGTLIVEDLPALSPEQQYQLWLIKDGQRASGAVFSVDPDGYSVAQISSPASLKEYPAFGITVEPAGGSPGPTGNKVLGN